MSGPADLTIDGTAAWLRLLVGLAVFLLPGLAAADRLLKGTPLRLIWSPLFSFTLLALAAILLNFVMGLTIRTAATATIALGLAVLIGRPRWQGWLVQGIDRLRRSARSRGPVT